MNKQQTVSDYIQRMLYDIEFECYFTLVRFKIDELYNYGFDIEEQLIKDIKNETNY